MLDLDELEKELAPQREVLQNSKVKRNGESKARSVGNTHIVSQYELSDPYDVLSINKDESFKTHHLEAAGRRARKGTKQEQEILEGLERLEEEFRNALLGKDGMMDDDEEDDADRGPSYNVHRYPKMVVRDVRHRLRSLGHPEPLIRQIEHYIAMGWRMQMEQARKREADTRRKKRSKAGGLRTTDDLSVKIPEGASSARTPRIDSARTPRTPGRDGRTPRSTGRDSARTSTAGGGDTARSGGSAWDIQVEDVLDKLVMRPSVLHMLLAGEKHDDVRVFARLNAAEDEEGRPEGLGKGGRDDQGTKEMQQDDEDKKHSAAELVALLLMAGVKDEEIKKCFERSELETLLAERLMVMYAAAVHATRMTRAALSMIVVKEKRDLHDKDTKAARDIQRMLRAKLQMRHGQQMMADMRREIRLQDLGEDATVLTLLEQAQDGDIISIPKGHHYVKVTTLAKAITTATQTVVDVVNGSVVRIGADVVIGRETMRVVTRSGNTLTVERRPPAILWEMMKAVTKRAEERMVARDKARLGVRRAVDATMELIKAWEHYTVDNEVGMNAREWKDMVEGLLGDKRDPEVASSFRWLAEGHVRINFVSLLLAHVQRDAEAGGTQALTAAGLDKWLKVCWKQQVRNGLLDNRRMPLYEVPDDKLSSEYKADVEAALRSEFDHMGLTLGAANSFVVECAEIGVLRGRLLSRERFVHVVDTIDHQCEHVKAHAQDSVVRSEGRIGVPSVVEIVAEQGAVIHGTLVLRASFGGLYLRTQVAGDSGPRKLYQLVTEASQGSDGARDPIHLVDVSTRDVVWSRDTHPRDYLDDVLEECEQQRGSVRGVTVLCEGGDALRVEGGEWDVSRSSFRCAGAASDAVVCGLAGHVRLRACDMGGLDSARMCRNVVAVANGGNLHVSVSALSFGSESALRVASSALAALERCSIKDCAAAVQAYAAYRAKIELKDNKFENIRRVWADGSHRPIRGHVLESGNNLTFKDWKTDKEREKEMRSKADGSQDDDESRDRDASSRVRAGGSRVGSERDRSSRGSNPSLHGDDEASLWMAGFLSRDDE